MAQATLNPATVTLVLTQEEAQLLADIGGCIGGDPSSTRRGLMDVINATLGSVGFSWDKPSDYELEGAIYCKN